ncbi:dTDP-4-amino-4,6-dideoxygalactose transaminase [uncultured Dokdonia sp.]|uniref:dTDP-4-amino-4,6-dideoxygalactose transaminase n=1 Tax=uncultured Dokdonia sp. TaxID=575653 RepID=UPI00262E36B7|nr:dTDP-4-amino-4,6-dideoxygalactose transaminase [uncultured Dokdonia sp.]
MIPFNKPYLTGNETLYINEAVASGKISGNGNFTQKCQSFFEDTYGFKKCLLTTSCTDALEMAALLLNIKPGDEVIVPSYTFVSSALAFIREGAKIVFADSMDSNPNIDAQKIEGLLTEKTKVIVVVHYAGVAVDMDPIMKLSRKHNFYVVEDAAQSIDSYYKGKALGSIGHLSAFSFHETKNIISGEGGMLAINDEALIPRSEIIWEKGTNRASFFRGEINKYGWVDTGSSFLPSEVIAAFLYAQLENIESIQKQRLHLWNTYYDGLKELGDAGNVQLPFIPEYATNNAHMFYLICNTAQDRNELIQHIRNNGAHAVFHYLSLHKSDYYLETNETASLPHSEKYTDCLVRLPFYYELSDQEVQLVIHAIHSFFEKK